MLFEVDKLQFSYESLDFFGDFLLNEITFKVDSILQIRGKNGSGKTTLLRILAGILPPISGDIKYNGHSIFNNSYNYKNSICYVGHKLGLNLQLTVFENCYYYLKNSKEKLEIMQLLEIFSLTGLENKLTGLLSTGQKKRLSLLRVLLSDSKLWILDEPFTALDQDFIDLFVKYICDHISQKGIIIYTSHQAVHIDNIAHSEYVL